jgi:hypothetical protein
MERVSEAAAPTRRRADEKLPRTPVAAPEASTAGASDSMDDTDDRSLEEPGYGYGV